MSSTPSRIRTDALLIESQGSLATRRWEQEPSRSTTGDCRTCGSPGRHTIDPPPPWDAVPIRVSPALLRTHSPKASELQHGRPVQPGFASPGTSARSGGTLTVRQHGLRQVSWHARRDSNPHRQRFVARRLLPSAQPIELLAFHHGSVSAGALSETIHSRRE